MMSNVATIGLDIAKSVFQIHGVDALGQVVIRRKLTRGRVLGFFEKRRDVSSGSKPAVRRTIGLVSSSQLAMMCGCCRRSM
jgi:transposase